MKRITKLSLAALRIAVGSHLFISGLVKLIDPAWTAKPFLDGSFAFFKWLSAKPFLLQVIDQLNIWILLISGAALVAGICKRFAALLALGLLILYYAAYPPINIFQSTGGLGPEFIFTPLLIEILFLVVLITSSGMSKSAGIWKPFNRSGKNNSQHDEVSGEVISLNSRRQMLKSLATVPFLGLISLPFIKASSNKEVDAIGGATAPGMNSTMPGYQKLKYLDLSIDEEAMENQENMPYGTIGNLRISRLIADNSYLSNEFFGQHSIHLQELAQTYFSKERIYYTLKSMEVQGINTMILSLKNVIDHKLMDYFKEWNSQLQWISEIKANTLEKFEEYVRRNVDYGASAILISREVCDAWVASESPEFLDHAIKIVGKYKVPAGIGAYSNTTIAYAMERKLSPDFFLKSFHNAPERNKGNFFCDKTAHFSDLIKTSEIPWIGFRTSAGGYMNSFDGYKFGMESGASFICDNMFDFQVKRNVEVFRQAINLL